MRGFFVLFLALAGFSGKARAASGDVSLELDAGSSLVTQTARAGGAVGGDSADEGAFTWNAAYSKQKSITSLGGGTNVVDVTGDLSGGVGWNGASGWDALVSLDYSRTPAESLVSQGMNFNFAHEWNQGREGEDDFRSVSLGLVSGTTNYVEQFNGTTVKGKGKIVPVSGSTEIRQFLLGVTAAWQPARAWKFDLGASFYGYNRGVSSFVNALNSPLGLNRGLGAFGNTVGGFPSSSFSVEAKRYWLENLDTDALETFSVIAVGGRPDSSTRIAFDWGFTGTWKATFGAEYETSSVLTTWLGIVGAAWGF